MAQESGGQARAAVADAEMSKTMGEAVWQKLRKVTPSVQYDTCNM